MNDLPFRLLHAGQPPKFVPCEITASVTAGKDASKNAQWQEPEAQRKYARHAAWQSLSLVMQRIATFEDGMSCWSMCLCSLDNSQCFQNATLCNLPDFWTTVEHQPQQEIKRSCSPWPLCRLHRSQKWPQASCYRLHNSCLHGNQPQTRKLEMTE
jgi:hypothetical protein